MKEIFNKRQRFSIRKFSVGVASVLIGITMFQPSQQVFAATENTLPVKVEVSLEKERIEPIDDKIENVATTPENRTSTDLSEKASPSNQVEKVGTANNKQNVSSTETIVSGEDRSATPEIRAVSNSSEVKKYELTEEYAKQIKAGTIGSEGDKLDSLLLSGPTLTPEGFTDNDYLKDKDEVYIYEKNGKKYVGYNSHPMLEDTDGDGIIDSKEKADEKLKWNVSERDMIMFMELAYRDDQYIDRVLDHKRPLTESDLYKKNGDTKPRYEYMMMNKELGPYWERKKSYHTSSGLDAVLFETKSDFSYLPNGTAQVLAFRGTSDAKDIKEDITLGFGGNPQQGVDAENIMRDLANDKSITNLYLTGHSLGGYLVQRAMVEAYQLAYSDSRVMSPKENAAYKNFYNNILKKGITFNAPKVVTSLVSKKDFWQKGLDSKKIAQAGKMTHYITDNDITVRKNLSNDSDVVINVGSTSGGHSSRSYFEADMINRRPEFISGKRISLDATGYQDPKLTTIKSVEKVEETIVYSKRGDDIIKSTTVSAKDSDTGKITKNTTDEVFEKNGAKAKVEVTTIPKTTRYEKDDKREKDTPNVTIEGRNGSRTVTTTYTVNATTGEAIAHRGNPVVEEAQPTIVKVGTKAKVEYLKDGDNIVKKTTTYDVNTDTGTVTPSEKTGVYKENGAKAKVEVTTIPKTTRYEKDDKREKDTPNVTIEGRDGSRTVTTTYTVNATTGEVIAHRENPVVIEAQPTIVKVGTKAKVEYLKDGDNIVKKTTTYEVNTDTGMLIPTVTEEIVSPNGVKYTVVVTTIESPIRYEKDSTREKGETNIIKTGTTGTSTVTTTYEVNPENGELIPREGEPVVVPATETVVKVAAKDEEKYIKKGNDVVKEMTTYTVNPTNGTLTPTVTEEVVKKDGAKNTDVVTPIASPIRYEKDSTRLKGEANITETGTPGTSTVTTTYEVNPEDGSLIPNVGQPVIVPATETVVKVPAKDEVKYIKKGNDVVKELTTYEVNPTNGTLTPTVTEEVVKKGEPLSPEVPKNNKELIENTEEKIPVEVNKESKINSETIERNTNKIERFNPIASEKELVLPVIDYLLVHRVDKITETVSNVYSLREVEKVEYEKTVIPFNYYLPNNLNEILLTDNVSIKETTQVESVTTKNEELEVKSTTEAETSTEGKSNSEVPNEKVKTEKVEHTETSRNNRILIAETVAVLVGVGVLTTVLKRKKLKD